MENTRRMMIHTSSARQTHSRFAQRNMANRAGLFLVPPGYKPVTGKASAKSSQSAVHYVLAATLGAPLLWTIHSLLHLLPVR